MSCSCGFGVVRGAVDVDGSSSSQRPWTVGFPKSCCTLSLTPREERRVARRRSAATESPPSSKKLPVWQQRVSAGTRKMLAMAARTWCSSSLAGGTTSPASPENRLESFGRGRRSRCTLPLALSGILLTVIQCFGIMYDGSDSEHRARKRGSNTSSSIPIAGSTTTYAARLPSKGVAAAAVTPGSITMTSSISPSSTRKPFTFTCESSRPRISRLPSGRSRPKSPVRKSHSPAC
mmetsp:Transcript_5114/g.10544  ORF Transcript_5114/g.10544 Transcript_5114/m.10544 type:complete len:234 (-) Transcript_5114:552-1253(-)